MPAKIFGDHMTSASKKSSAASIADCPQLFRAVSSFVHAHTNFESMVLTDELIAQIGKCTTLAAAFECPIKSARFSMDSALHWLVFLHMAVDHAGELGDPTAGLAPLNTATAIKIITDVYDTGVEDTVWEHFADDDASDEDDDDE